MPHQAIDCQHCAQHGHRKQQQHATCLALHLLLAFEESDHRKAPV